MLEVILYLLSFFVVLDIYISGKYQNPYKLRMYFGKKGCGKTTHICKMSMKYIKKGIPVYTTEFIPGTYHIEYQDIGTVQFPENSVIFVDEVGMIWDNRDFKKFDKAVRNFFKLQRHYKVTIYLYSQCFDIDKKLRDLCDELYIMKSHSNCISICKRIKKDLTIVEAHGEAESRITDDLKVVPWFIPGSRKFTYLPKYHKYFDSYAAPELEHKEYELTPVKEFPTAKEVVQKWMKEQLKFKRDKGIKTLDPVLVEKEFEFIEPALVRKRENLCRIFIKRNKKKTVADED